MLGALAYDNWYDPENNPNGPFDPLFLDEFLLAGGGAYFDIINFHYYPAWSWIWESGDEYTSGIYSKATYLVIQVRFFSGLTKPIICTELGMPFTGSEGPAASAHVHPNQIARPNSPAYTDEEISRYIVKAYSRGMSYGILAIIWFEAVDESNLAYQYGLLQSDLTPRPAYKAYQTMTQQLTGTTFQRTRRDLPIYIEGYDFDNGSQTVTVLWTTDTNMHAVSLALAGSGGIMQVVDKFGVTSYIADGSPADGDHTVDGRVTINADQDPRYVRDAGQQHTYLGMLLRN